MKTYLQYRGGKKSNAISLAHRECCVWPQCFHTSVWLWTTSQSALPLSARHPQTPTGKENNTEMFNWCHWMSAYNNSNQSVDFWVKLTKLLNLCEYRKWVGWTEHESKSPGSLTVCNGSMVLYLTVQWLATVNHVVLVRKVPYLYVTLQQFMYLFVPPLVLMCLFVCP